MNTSAGLGQQTMAALVKQYDRPGLWLRDIPIPEMGDHDVLVKISHTAICGTDMHIYNWDEWAQATVPVGMAVGHEFVGHIVAKGSQVQAYQIGQRVSGEGHITCGQCRNCRAGRRHLCIHTVGIGVNRAGAFAEYLSLPVDNVFLVPDNIDDHHAAIFDPLGNAVHTALSFDLVGEDVLITGAGPIGLMATAIARHVGARQVVVTDVNPHRLGLASAMGATRCVNVAKEDLSEVMAHLNIHEGFDVGLEMSGVGSAFEQMLKHMNHGGKIAMLGILGGKVAINWGEVIFKSLTIKGIYGREMYETWYKAAAMLQSGLSVEPILTHEFNSQDFEQGFAAMAAGTSGKVVLKWS